MKNTVIKTNAASHANRSVVRARQPDNLDWCIGCSPDNCSGCGPVPSEAEQKALARIEIESAQ